MKYLAYVTLILITTICNAGKITTEVFSTDTKQSVGKVTFEDTAFGLLIIPDFKNLPSGLHGFHIHENPSCEDKGNAAGEHLDPKNTKTHQGPYKPGHLGDLPVLYVNNKGEATTPTLAPRLKTRDLHEHAIIIHEGGDTYSDNPHLGGGGARIACGVIESKNE